MAIKAGGSGRDLNAVLSGKLDPGAAIVPGTRRTLDELLTALRKVWAVLHLSHQLARQAGICWKQLVREQVSG